MDSAQKTDHLRTIVVDKILDCLDSPSHHSLLELSTMLENEPTVHTDIPLLQSITLLDFLAKQVTDGNNDIITQPVIQEVYAYILEKLTHDKKKRYNN